MSRTRSQRRSQSAREERRKANDERVAVWREMSPDAQRRSLDGRLGTGVGAVRQRKMLDKRMKATAA